ncbi:MAG: GFA family protein [Parvularculaceae bacterium]|nr:GFA family protein [Parvularculaceae bacterium]
MSKVSLPLAGGCACGALRYELTAPPLMIYNCHCANCQKITGSAFTVAATVFESALSFTKGAPKRTSWTADSGNERFGLFCGDCGSRIANGQTGKDGAPSVGMLSLRAGTFDDTSWVEPVGDIWTKSAQGWIAFRGLTAEGQPTDYSPFVAAYRAQERF